jgi:predicted RNase H-like HicB family nuclease
MTLGTGKTVFHKPMHTLGAAGRQDHHFIEAETTEENTMKIDIEKEEDGRWIAEVSDLPGVLAYGKTREDAIAKVEALALRVIADRIDHGETIPELDELFAVPA